MTLARVPRADADVIRSLLTGCGITAVVVGGDADGWYPNLGFADGAAVQVFEDDLDEARRILESAPELASDDWS